MKPFIFLKVIEAFKKASRREVKYKIVSRREGDVASSYCDASLAKKELDWQAEKTIQEMCKFFIYFNYTLLR